MADDKNGLIALFVALFAMIIALASIVNTFSGNYSDLTDKPIIDKYIDLQHGLVLWLPFDGSVLDKSGYGFDGSVFGGVSYGSGYFFKSAVFDGVDGRVSCGSDMLLDDLSSFSYCAWLCPSNNDEAYVMWKDLKILSHWAFNDSFYGWVGAGVMSAYSSSVEKLVGDSWNFVVMTYDDGGDRMIHLYLDGAEVSYTIQRPANGDLVSDASSDFFVSSVDHPFNGLVDDVRVYNRVLSGYEIEQLYNLGV